MAAPAAAAVVVVLMVVVQEDRTGKSARPTKLTLHWESNSSLGIRCLSQIAKDMGFDVSLGQAPGAPEARGTSPGAIRIWTHPKGYRDP